MSKLPSPSPCLVLALCGLPFFGILAAACGGNVVVDQPASCEEGLTLCGVVCVDLGSNAKHCGACGVDCGAAVCAGGACSGPTPDCSGDLVACGGACVDLKTDEDNCGSCGNVCPDDWECHTSYCEFFGCVCDTVCSAILLEPAVPQTAVEDTSFVGDSVTPACGPPGGNDVTFAFAAPAAGFYSFRTAGSAVDTTLQVMSAATCQVLACDEGVLLDDGGMLGVELAENEIVLVTVDTPQGGGEVQLTVVDEVGCRPCVEFALGLGPEDALCADSLAIYNTLESCVCTGPCAGVCQDICSGELGNDACQQCVSDQSNGCGAAFDACLDDG